ncbi:hypothetical protein B0H14DRAFT_2739394 [Mycena olivaceomarginata]|nr:hypothetical protein B0H14DRAFT_2739394 [Mycena olivaceomarginata]
MDFQSTVGKLSSPLKDLVLSATQNGTLHVGKQEKDQGEVIEWIAKIGAEQNALVNETGLKTLDTQLVPRTYLSKLQPPQYLAHPAVTRYFDHIQAAAPVRAAADALAPAFARVPLDFADAPRAERKVEAPKKKEKAKAPEAQQEAGTSKAPPAEAAAAPGEGKAQKKEKKEKKKDAAPGDEAGGGKKKGAPAKAAAADDGEPVPSMIDLRVGHIVDIMKHPDADWSCNLKPANMRGVKSFAMVLCATSKEGKDGGIELIQPPANAKPGDRVYFEGAEFADATPLAQLNPKKKIFETIQPGFITLDSKEAAWVNPTTKSVHKIRTQDGVCVAPTLVGASLS